MPGALRPAFAAASLVAGLVTALVAGCGTAGGAGIPSAAPASGPVAAPEGGPLPAGTVLDLAAPATAVVADPATGTVAVALTDPPRLLLHPLRLLDPSAPLSAPDSAGASQQVPLPGPAVDLALAGAGGPLLVPVTAAGALLRVPLLQVPTDDSARNRETAAGETAGAGTPSRTDLDGARAAVEVGRWTVVASGDRLIVLEGAALHHTIPGFADAARLVPAGNKVGVLDRGRTALTLVDPDSGTVGPALRAGNAAAQAVADRFGRILVTDVADGELLFFAGDPLLLRQRFPLPGGPYGLAYDPRRDVAWVTLTARNEVVGLRVTGGEPVVIHRFPTVHQPDSVAVDPASGRVLIASASGAGLQVIDPERVVH